MIIHTFSLVNNIFFIGPILWTTPARRCIDLFRAGGCFGVAQLQTCSLGQAGSGCEWPGQHSKLGRWPAYPPLLGQGAPPQAHPAPRSPAAGLRNSSIG